MPAILIADCCVEHLGTPNQLSADTSTACGVWQRSWTVRPCEGEGSEWFCAEPGLGTTVEFDEAGEEVEVTVTLAWGGGLLPGTAFTKEEEDDATVQARLGRTGSGQRV